MNDPVSPDHTSLPSERSFGLVFATVFLAIGLYPLLDSGNPRSWSIALSAIFALTAWLKPSILGSLNKIWFRFGLLLHKIVNPIVMGAIYAVVICSAGFIMRIARKNPLRLGTDPRAESYWIDREPGPSPESFKQPF